MGPVERLWRTERTSLPRGGHQRAKAKEARVGGPTVVGWKHRQPDGVRLPGDTRTAIVVDVNVLHLLHQRELLEVRLQAEVVPERDRKVLGESPLEEDGHWAVAQQAAKQVGRRLDRLCVTTRSAHPTQLGGGRAKPCRRVVLSGNTRP